MFYSLFNLNKEGSKKAGQNTTINDIINLLPLIIPITLILLILGIIKPDRSNIDLRKG